MTDNNENKVLNVPHLRFPEFSGEWEIYPLTDFMSFKNGMNPDAKRFGRGTKFISVMDILNNQFICYDNIRASVEVVDGDIETYGVNYGDILFQRSSETLEDVGQANVYLDSKPAVFGGFVIRGKSKSNYYPMFFRYLLASPTARKKIIVKGAGAQHFNIGQDGLSKVCLNIPSIQEQEKIAKLFECIDTRIATQNKIIEDLKILKSAIIEKHYRCVKKHSVRVEELGKPFSVGNLSKDDLSEIGVPCIIYGELFTTYGAIINKVESHTKKIDGMTLSRKGDLLFPSSTTVDAVSLIAPSAINVDGVILGGDMFGIHVNSNFDAQYLSYFFNHIAKNQFAKYAKGSTIIHLHHTDIDKAKLLLPCLEEQNRMAMCMVSLDEKITIESAILKTMLIQKSYLLRQMFI